MIFFLLHKKTENKEQEHHRRPLNNICKRFHAFLVNLLATQALKKVVFGYPSAQKEQTSDIICDAGRNIEKNEMLTVEKEELRVPKERAPRKIVSIKEEVDEIRISSRRIKKKISKGSFSSFDHELMSSLRPLKSILRKDSGVANDI
ncbi:unnamed protein product [Cochlearia groenlandica]